MTPNAVLAIVVFFLGTHWLFSALAAALGCAEVLIWIIYYTTSHALESQRLTHRPDWRASRFAAWVGRRLMRTQFDLSLIHI